MLQKDVDYIRLPDTVISPGRWRANPNDPFIYVSFSTRQLSSTFRNDNNNNGRVPLHILSLLQLNEETVALFKTIIQDEWVSKAKLPLRFLPEGLSREETAKKNVCFIVHSEEEKTLDLEVKAEYPMTMAYNTYPYPDDAENKLTEASYKVIWLPHIAPGKVPTQTIFRFLHQTGHAFAEFKNAIDIGKGLNYPPYNPNLTCLDTVMVSSHTNYCPTAKISFRYPTQLGLIDIVGAAEFIQAWENRNRVDLPSDPNAIYIRTDNSNLLNTELTAGRWRPNPQDPFIYVSFSLKQLILASSHENFGEQMPFMPFEDGELDGETMEKFKATIQNEWIDKATFPLKFLPEDISQEEIFEKNVCFIIHSLIVTKADVKTRGTVTSYERRVRKQDEPIEISYKIIWFPHIVPGEVFNEASQLTIFALLHETGHAFAEFKHAIQTPQEFNNPPYNSKLTCLDTVMITSAEFCPAADGRSPYPSQLGPVDISGAREFVKEWESRNNLALSCNKAPQTPITLTKYVEFFNNQELPIEQKNLSQQYNQDNYFSQLRKSLWQFKTRGINQINSLFNSMLNKSQDYAREVVEQCPSYFVQNDVSQQQKQTQLTFFARHTETVANNCTSYLSHNSNRSMLHQ